MRNLLKLLPWLLCGLLLAGCASGPRINDDYTSRDQDSRVQYIVLHYTAAGSQQSLKLLTQAGVSAHYLIDTDGTVYRLVDENRRAWHAGVSEWEGRTWLNSTSIGIEMVNLGFRETPTGRQWYPFSEAQIQALIPLLKDIEQRHGLDRRAIVGHSDIAPGRKQDPGPLFPWARLAAAGLINWPDPAVVAQRQASLGGVLPPPAWFQDQLARIGYAVPRTGALDPATRDVIGAFQMKYRPGRFDGQPDLQTAALLLSLPSGR